jgi:hypothetical protein
MRLKAIKVGYSVKVGDREGVHFVDQGDQAKDGFRIEIIALPGKHMSVVEIQNKRTKAIAWTSFSNVVYAEPLQEVLIATESDTETDDLGSVEPVKRATRGRKPKVKSDELEDTF